MIGDSLAVYDVTVKTEYFLIYYATDKQIKMIAQLIAPDS